MIELSLDFPRIIGPGPIEFRPTDPVLAGIATHWEELSEGQRAEELAVAAATSLCDVLNSATGSAYVPAQSYETPVEQYLADKSADFRRFFLSTAKRKEQAVQILAAWRAINLCAAKSGDISWDDLETFSRSATVLDAIASVQGFDFAAAEAKIMQFGHKISTERRKLEWVAEMKNILGEKQ